MPVEIERKFRVRGDHWRAAIERSEFCRQGYLGGTKRCSARVCLGGARAWLGREVTDDERRKMR